MDVASGPARSENSEAKPAMGGNTMKSRTRCTGLMIAAIASATIFSATQAEAGHRRNPARRIARAARQVVRGARRVHRHHRRQLRRLITGRDRYHSRYYDRSYCTPRRCGTVISSRAYCDDCDTYFERGVDRCTSRQCATSRRPVRHRRVHVDLDRRRTEYECETRRPRRNGRRHR